MAGSSPDSIVVHTTQVSASFSAKVPSMSRAATLIVDPIVSATVQTMDRRSAFPFWALGGVVGVVSGGGLVLWFTGGRDILLDHTRARAAEAEIELRRDRYRGEEKPHTQV